MRIGDLHQLGSAQKLEAPFCSRQQSLILDMIGVSAAWADSANDRISTTKISTTAPLNEPRR
jgi:hypothetical protein